MHNLRRSASVVALLACLVAPAAGAKPPDRASTCAAIKKEAHAVIVKALKEVSFPLSPDVLLDAIAPIGTCVGPVLDGGQWALELKVAPALHATEIVDFSVETEDGAEPPETPTLYTLVNDWEPVFVTPDGRRLRRERGPEAMPVFSAYLDASGTPQAPSWPHDDRSVDAHISDKANTDGSHTAIFVTEGFVALLVRADHDGVTLDPGSQVLTNVTSVRDVNKDGFDDLLDGDTLTVHLDGDGRRASASFPLVALGTAGGAFDAASADVVAIYRQNCDGLGLSPWVLGRPHEDTALTNLACARILGTPKATILAGLAAEKAAVKPTTEDGDINEELLGDAYGGLLAWFDTPLPVFTDRDDAFVRLEVASATSSKAMKAFGVYAFDAAQVFDGDLGTSWQPKVKAKAWVELKLKASARIAALDIANGLQRQDALGDLFAKNSRVTAMDVTVGDRTFPVTVDPERRGFQRIDLPEAVEADTIRITIRATARGAKWDHVALSEIVPLAAR